MKHKWQFLQKSHQRAMEERVCSCGAHVRGPLLGKDGVYTGTDTECPIEKPCDCGRDGCLSNKNQEENVVCSCGNNGYCEACKKYATQNRKKKILVTGSAGFIFSNFMRKVMRDKEPYTFVSVDKVLATYNRYNVELNKDHTFYMGDIADEQFMDNIFALEKPDIVIHGAAESFVDDSIRSAKPFIHSNVVGTQVMVDVSLKYGIERFVYISTDEVYGQLKENEASWTEDHPISPRNPYSASKAAGELIVRAANQTHNLKYNITRCSNNYGPSQPPRNLVPKVVSCLLKNTPIPIHGNGKQFREWLYVDDHCSAIIKIVNKAPVNETYNIGSGVELTNMQMVKSISKVLNVDAPLVNFVKDRPGHDFRYSVNCSKIKQLGWEPSFDFDSGIKKCVKWYVDNPWYFDSVNL
jgi:dTDP-glucose 4,6-dehydratase